MAVYVDSYNAPYRGMIMCHMIADTTNELLAMVDTIGVDRKWIQKRGTPYEHFDICLTKKKQALRCGAIEITARELAMKCYNRRSLVSLTIPANGQNLWDN